MLEINYYNKLIGDFNILKNEINNLLFVIRKSNFKDYFGDSFSDYSVDFINNNPVEFFKNGMLFSFLSAIEDDAVLLKLEIQQIMFDYVQSFVVEQEIKKSNEVIDTAKFDRIIEKKSEEYSVDFASLDVGFVYKLGGDNNAQDTSSS